VIQDGREGVTEESSRRLASPDPPTSASAGALKIASRTRLDRFKPMSRPWSSHVISRMFVLAWEREVCREEWLSETHLDEAAADFEAFVRDRRAERQLWGVPVTELWFVDGEEYIGTVVVRHELTQELLESGGHVGFHVVPHLRRRVMAHACLVRRSGSATVVGSRRFSLHARRTTLPRAASLSRMAVRQSVLPEARRDTGSGPRMSARVRTEAGPQNKLAHALSPRWNSSRRGRLSRGEHAGDCGGASASGESRPRFQGYDPEIDVPARLCRNGLKPGLAPSLALGRDDGAVREPS
jgi:hypothetical protein